jgi:hypothetical protein
MILSHKCTGQIDLSGHHKGPLWLKTVSKSQVASTVLYVCGRSLNECLADWQVSHKKLGPTPSDFQQGICHKIRVRTARGRKRGGAEDAEIKYIER